VLKQYYIQLPGNPIRHNSRIPFDTDDSRIELIRDAVFERFSVSDKLKTSTWNACVISLNNVGRNIKSNAKKGQEAVDQCKHCCSNSNSKRAFNDDDYEDNTNEDSNVKVVELVSAPKSSSSSMSRSGGSFNFQESGKSTYVQDVLQKQHPAPPPSKVRKVIDKKAIREQPPIIEDSIQYAERKLQEAKDRVIRNKFVREEAEESRPGEEGEEEETEEDIMFINDEPVDDNEYDFGSD